MLRSTIVLCVAAMNCLLLTGCDVDPVSGNKRLMLLSPEDEAKLGKSYAPQVEKELGGRIPDENLQSYVNQVGQRMARVCHHPEFSYSYTAVQDPMINAFAVPGGHVFITRGLLEKLDSEAELASVLGHETGHVVAQHTAAAISRETVMTALVIAAGVGSGGREVGSTSFLAACLGLQYSRDDESEADTAGLSYMAQAGYDPNGMIGTMRILQKLQTERPIEFFSTHPDPETRIADIEDRIQRRFANVGQLKMGKQEYEEHVLVVLKDMKKKPGTAVAGETARQ
jgi:beta-barrel assembly-enhancing protease